MSDAPALCREPELYQAGESTVFCFNPGGVFHGWLLGRHGDGTLYAIRQLRHVPYVPGEKLARLLPAAPPPAAPDPAP